MRRMPGFSSGSGAAAHEGGNMRMRWPGAFIIKHQARRWLALAILFCSPAWCAAAIQWDEPWHVSSNGQRLSIETFASGMQPDAVVQEIVRHNMAYQRYLVADGRVLLSGVSSAAHWLAEVRGHPEGTHGYVSALYFDAARAGGTSLAALTHGGLPVEAADDGLRPMQVFEFEASARLSLMKASHSSARAAATGDLLLITGDTHAPMALAVSIPEN